MRAESGPEARRHARGGSGAGCGGMIARLNKSIFLNGALRHESNLEPNGVVRNFRIFGDVKYKNIDHQGAMIMQLIVCPDVREEVCILACYETSFLPPLMPNKMFRDILSKYLSELAVDDGLDEVARKGIEKYLDEDLVQYSEAAIKFEEAMQAMAEIKRNLSDPENIRKLDQVLCHLEVESACDSYLVVE